MLPPLLAGPSWRETPGHFSTQPGEKTSSAQSPSPARTFCPELRFPSTSEHMIQTSCSGLGFPEASHRCQQHGLSRLPWPTPEECPGVRSKDSNSPPHSWMLPSPDVKGIPLPTDNGLISRMPPKWSQVPQARNPGLSTSLPWRGGSFPEHHTGGAHSYGGPLFAGPACCFKSHTTCFCPNTRGSRRNIFEIRNSPRVFVPSLMVLRINPLRQSKQLK